jgi:hypothetical protein
MVSQEGQTVDTTGSTSAETGETLVALRRFAKRRQPAERCELCGVELHDGHQHLLDRQTREIACACDACAILFCTQENAKFIRVPRRIIALHGPVLDDSAWNATMLPINLAFFLREPSGATVAMYPSPAGAMASLVELPPWNVLFADSQILSSVEPEVEALLVNRVGNEASHFLVPIDECYRLVGLIRTSWRGLSGGRELWDKVGEYFTSLRRRARSSGGATHA